MEFTAFDSYALEGKLVLPEGEEEIPKLIFYVHGTGPQPYAARADFNGSLIDMFDIFIEGFTENGAAFFTYSQRGVHVTDETPYMELNLEEYKTYLSVNSVEDIYVMLKEIKKDERLKNSKVYLFGGSEGTKIAAMFAEKFPDMVDGLLLFGYMNYNLRDVLVWQLNGEGLPYLFNEVFETDQQGRVSREAWEAVTPEQVENLSLSTSVLVNELLSLTFDGLDTNENGFVEKPEMAALVSNRYSVDALLEAVEARDDEYTFSSTRVTSGWLAQHFSLRDNMDILPGLDIPIYIFHGSVDMNVDVQGVYDIEEKFKELGKTNLEVNVFKGHEHSLNLNQSIITGELSEGLQAIIDTVAELE